MSNSKFGKLKMNQNFGNILTFVNKIAIQELGI